MKKLLAKTGPVLLIPLLLLVLFWLTDYKNFTWSDLKLILIILLMTGIMLLLHGDLSASYKRFPYYLFISGFLCTLLLIYQTLLDNIHDLTHGLIMSLKPLVYSTILYFPGNIIFKRPSQSDWITELTPREMEVLTLVRENLSNKEIAANLYISETTVKKHVQNIMKKADHNDRTLL